MINVVNKRVWKGDGIYVGRPRRGQVSPLGNPFPLSKYSREESIARFRVWLWDRICAKDRKILQALWEIVSATEAGDVNLICWCKPLACHGDVVKACADWMIKTDFFGKGVN
jgi:hypothetical protein